MTMVRGSSSLVPEAVMAIVCVGADLAKNGFAVDGVDEVGNAARTSVIEMPPDWSLPRRREPTKA